MQRKINTTFRLSDMTNCNKMSNEIIYLLLFQTNYRQKEKQILDRILDQEVYDSRMRPTGINSTGLFTAPLYKIKTFMYSYFTYLFIKRVKHRMLEMHRYRKIYKNN